MSESNRRTTHSLQQLIEILESDPLQPPACFWANEIAAVALDDTPESADARVYLAVMFLHEHEGVRAVAYATYLDLAPSARSPELKVAASAFACSAENADLVVWTHKRRGEVPEASSRSH